MKSSDTVETTETEVEKIDTCHICKAPFEEEDEFESIDDHFVHKTCLQDPVSAARIRELNGLLHELVEAATPLVMFFEFASKINPKFAPETNEPILEVKNDKSSVFVYTQALATLKEVVQKVRDTTT